jgi:hypothetical protein
VTNRLKTKYLVIGVWCLVSGACGGKNSNQTPTPEPTAPLPTAGLAGQRVAVTPLALVGAEEALHWDTVLADRRATLDKCDSIINTLLAARSPEVTWVGPAELRHIARRAPGIAADPDQLGTPFLRASNIMTVPDPLRYELRTLMGLAGGRYVLVPAALVFRAPPVGPSARPPAAATAELAVVMIDSRLGKVGWRTIARGVGDDPWTALTHAMKSLTPGLP